MSTRRRLLVVALTTCFAASIGIAVGLVVAGDRGTDGPPASPAWEERPTAARSSGTTERRVSIASLEIGTCIDEDFRGPEEVNQFALAVVDCSEPHGAQVFHITKLEGHFPGDDEVERRATAACESAFETWIGIPPQYSTLEHFHYAPTRESWPSGHEVLCIAVAPEQVSGTLEGSGL